MLNAVSWEEYIEIVGVLMAIYYSLLALYWCYPQLSAWWRRQQTR